MYLCTAYTGLLIGPFGAAVPCTPVRATAYAYGPMRQGSTHYTQHSLLTLGVLLYTRGFLQLGLTATATARGRVLRSQEYSRGSRSTSYGYGARAGTARGLGRLAGSAEGSERADIDFLAPVKSGDLGGGGARVGSLAAASLIVSITEDANDVTDLNEASLSPEGESPREPVLGR